jgi:exodeoxyribonuclease III
VYFPNAGRGPERLAYKLEFYHWFQDMCDALTKTGKSVVVVGDVNTTHSKLDFHFSDVRRSVRVGLPKYLFSSTCFHLENRVSVHDTRNRVDNVVR